MNKLAALALVLIIILADQFADRAISEWLAGQSITSYPISPFLNLVSIRNTGISFGLLHDMPYGQWVLVGLASLVVSILATWLFRTSSLKLSCALGLIIGGAVGNIIERARDGAVFDFLDFHVSGWHWPAFNITDSAIVLGVFFLIYQEISNSYNACLLKRD